MREIRHAGSDVYSIVISSINSQRCSPDTFYSQDLRQKLIIVLEVKTIGRNEIKKGFIFPKLTVELIIKILRTERSQYELASVLDFH